MQWLKNFVLYPLSLFYLAITSVRNLLFDRGILKSVSFPFPVICVGNITVGGTGKTPHVEYIARMLSKKMNTAVVSRGYMRSGKGFRLVSPEDSARLTGDEPLQIAMDLPVVRVAVDADRVNGISIVSEMNPPSEVVILDDGFQHRSVKAGLYILLTDYGRLMTRDHVMPCGRLRESLKGKKRAQIIIVSKTPSDLTSAEMDNISEELNPSADQHLFFTTLEYGEITPVFSTADTTGHLKINNDTEILLITGIANPVPLTDYLKSMSSRIKHIQFRDHHRFTDQDICNIRREWDEINSDNKIIITTQKDSVRLKDFSNFVALFRNNLFFIPVRIRFINNEDNFIKIITDYVGKNT